MRRESKAPLNKAFGPLVGATTLLCLVNGGVAAAFGQDGIAGAAARFVFVALGVGLQRFVWNDRYFPSPALRRAMTQNMEDPLVMGHAVAEREVGPESAEVVQAKRRIAVAFALTVGAVFAGIQLTSSALLGALVFGSVVAAGFAIAATPSLLWAPLLASTTPLAWVAMRAGTSKEPALLVMALCIGIEGLVFAWLQMNCASLARLSDHPLGGMLKPRTRSWRKAALTFVVFATAAFYLMPTWERDPHNFRVPRHGGWSRQGRSYADRTTPQPSPEAFPAPLPGRQGPAMGPSPSPSEVRSIPGRRQPASRTTATQWPESQAEPMRPGETGAAGAAAAANEQVPGGAEATDQNAAPADDQDPSRPEAASRPRKPKRATSPESPDAQPGEAPEARPSPSAPRESPQDPRQASGSARAEKSTKASSSPKSNAKTQRKPKPEQSINYLPLVVLGVVLVAVAFFLMRKKKKKAEEDEDAQKLDDPTEPELPPALRREAAHRLRRDVAQRVARAATTDAERRALIVDLYNLLLAHAERCGFPRELAETADEFAVVQIASHPQHGRAVRLVTQTFARARYDGPLPDDEGLKHYVAGVEALGGLDYGRRRGG